MAVRTSLYCVFILMMSGSCGCAKTPGHERFVPEVDVARKALATVLEAWKQDQPVGMIADTEPHVHITDSHRKQGQKLEKYQILGEVPGDAPRCFAVKLKFSNPVAEERARFAVLGIDPLWVFRHEDLEMLSHWSHPMEEESPKTEKSAPEKVDSKKTNAK